MAAAPGAPGAGSAPVPSVEPVYSDPITVKTKAADTMWYDVSRTFLVLALWLVKLPTSLVRSWDAVPYGEELGAVNVYTLDDARGKVMELVARTPQGDAAYQMQPREAKNLSVFTAAGEAVNFRGRVEAKYELLPARRGAHFLATVAQTALEARPQIETKRESKHAGLAAQAAYKTDLRAQSPPSPRDKDKRERRDRDSLLDDLFALFREQPQWTLVDLEEATEQPRAWLKEVLGQICVLNKTGPARGKYELRAEYAGRRTMQATAL